VGRPWIEFWQGDERVKAGEAVEAAKAGHTTQFEGPANTAKGNRRYWEVTLAPVLGPNRKPLRLLSISRDVSARHEAEFHRRLLFEEMHHRIKNTLATVQAIAHQSIRHSADLAEAELSGWPGMLPFPNMMSWGLTRLATMKNGLPIRPASLALTRSQRTASPAMNASLSKPLSGVPRWAEHSAVISVPLGYNTVTAALRAMW
jgi:hypothetical protein